MSSPPPGRGLRSAGRRAASRTRRTRRRCSSLVVWSPGDNDLLKILDEDEPPAGQPVLRIDGSGAIVHRTTQIHADHVFEREYPLESIEEHAAAMTGAK